MAPKFEDAEALQWVEGGVVGRKAPRDLREILREREEALGDEPPPAGGAPPAPDEH